MFTRTETESIEVYNDHIKASKWMGQSLFQEVAVINDFGYEIAKQESHFRMAVFVLKDE